MWTDGYWTGMRPGYSYNRGYWDRGSNRWVNGGWINGGNGGYHGGGYYGGGRAVDHRGGYGGSATPYRAPAGGGYRAPAGGGYHPSGGGARDHRR
jgi:hypothetical protein